MTSTASTFVENYMDCVESLPDDMQRSVSQMLEIDLHYQDKLKDIERLLNNFYKDKDTSSRKRSLFNIKRCLCKTQELGDEKLQIVSQMVDMVDNKSRHIEMDMENLDTLRNDDTPSLLFKQEVATSDISDDHLNILKPMEPPKSNKRNRRLRQPDKPDPVDHTSPEKSNTEVEKKSDSSKKTTKKKVKSRKKAKTSSPPAEEIPIDPNEPTYCHCNQVSFGEMIGCDNDDCPIEWFHFSCVGLSTKPKGKWYCANCQADRKKERNSR